MASGSCQISVGPARSSQYGVQQRVQQFHATYPQQRQPCGSHQVEVDAPHGCTLVGFAVSRRFLPQDAPMPEPDHQAYRYERDRHDHLVEQLCGRPRRVTEHHQEQLTQEKCRRCQGRNGPYDDACVQVEPPQCGLALLWVLGYDLVPLCAICIGQPRTDQDLGKRTCQRVLPPTPTGRHVTSCCAKRIHEQLQQHLQAGGRTPQHQHEASQACHQHKQLPHDSP